jgi:hypothetical protein
LLILNLHQLAVDLLDFLLFLPLFPLPRPVLLFALPVLLLLLLAADHPADMDDRVAFLPEHHRVLVAGEPSHQVELFLAHRCCLLDVFLGVVVEAVPLHEQLFLGNYLLLGLPVLLDHLLVNG